METYNQKFMDEAVALSIKNVEENKGGPFGAVIVKNNAVIARGVNLVTATNDPTAHAEIVAIRRACTTLTSFQLIGCQVYTSCEPCPMCFGALMWARPEKIYFANSRDDAAHIGFDDALIYEQLDIVPDLRVIPCIHVKDSKALEAFKLWDHITNKVRY